MAKLDKDRYLKELAVQYCLLKGMLPYPEVAVSTTSELSDTVEVVTDIDVLGVGLSAFGGLYRTIFDCKSGKMSGISRALWANGLVNYTGCDDAVVLLKASAPYNHRVSALHLNVHLHDEVSFREIGSLVDPSFPDATHYQSALARWDFLNDAYSTNMWAANLRESTSSLVPLTGTPWNAFRRLLADARAVKGEFDPAKAKHAAIFLDTLSAFFLLWTAMGRDVRQIYDPAMGSSKFENALRYYLWGGKESYRIRQQIKESFAPAGESSISDLPAWAKLVQFAGLVIQEPNATFSCAVECRELALRIMGGPEKALDSAMKARVISSPRILQYVLTLADYVAIATGIPREFSRMVQDELTSVQK